MRELKKGIDYTGINVTFCCHDGEENFLFAKRSDQCRDEQGTWDCGGGSVDFGDSIEGTLVKEIMEEYCTDVISYDYLGFRDVFRTLPNGTKTHWLAIDFKVRVDRSRVRNGEPHKATEIGWFTLDNLPRPNHSQWPNFLRLYESRLRSNP